MKQHHLLSLLQTGFVTIKVVFQDAPNARPSHPYTYKARVEENVKVGDAVVVDSPRNGLVVVSVIAVDDKAKINTDSDYSYKWIVQKIDVASYQETLKREAEFLEVMQEVEREVQRALMVEKFKNHLPLGSAARELFDAAVAKATAPVIK